MMMISCCINCISFVTLHAVLHEYCKFTFVDCCVVRGLSIVVCINLSVLLRVSTKTKRFLQMVCNLPLPSTPSLPPLIYYFY